MQHNQLLVRELRGCQASVFRHTVSRKPSQPKAQLKKTGVRVVKEEGAEESLPLPRRESRPGGGDTRVHGCVVGEWSVCLSDLWVGGWEGELVV